MSSDVVVPGPAVPVRIPCGSLGCAFGPRRGLVGRLDEALAYAGPLAFGFAAVLHGCRLTWVMRWLKAGEDEAAELDPVG